MFVKMYTIIFTYLIQNRIISNNCSKYFSQCDLLFVYYIMGSFWWQLTTSEYLQLSEPKIELPFFIRFWTMLIHKKFYHCHYDPFTLYWIYLKGQVGKYMAMVIWFIRAQNMFTLYDKKYTNTITPLPSPPQPHAAHTYS